MKKGKSILFILDFIIIGIIIINNMGGKNIETISAKPTALGLASTEESDTKIVNAKDYGIISGTNSEDSENNTTKMQELIELCKNGKTIYFPEGEYLIGAVDLGDGNNISIKGESSENTKIIFQKTEETESFFYETASRIHLENLSFQGSLTEKGIEGTNFITGGNGQTRCRVVANNCKFTNWGTVFGGARYTNGTLEFENSDSNKSNYKLIAVLGMDCFFENNNIAISQIQDSRIVTCNFNNNKYDIIIDKGAGASVVTNNKTSNTQIESIIVNKAHDTNISNNELITKGMQITASTNINVYQNEILENSSITGSKNSNISNNKMNVEQTSDNEDCIVQNNDTKVNKTTIDVLNECEADISKYVNVLDFGVKAGLTKKQMNVDNSVKKETIIKENTENIQKAIEYCITNNKILYFPSGDYLTNTLNISDKDIIISGTSNNMIFYSNNSLGDNYSRLIYCGDVELPLFNCTNTNVKLQNIGIYGTVKSNGVTYGTQGATAIKNTDGKTLVNQCEFANWDVVLENGKIDSINSRFSYNSIALKNLKKSNIEFSSFNKNDYAIYLENSDADINLKYNRIEWNNINGIYANGYTGEKLVIEGNELDRQSNAGMYLVNSKNIDINGNIIRRSGSADALSETDENEVYEKNVQMYINNCSNIDVENNITVAKYNYDAKPTSETSIYKISPYKVSNITNNSKINVKYNIMNGAKDATEMNRIENSQFKYQSNVGIDDNEAHIVTYKYLAENGEEVIADSKEYVKNEEIDLSITVSKDGYKFLGWNTDKKATETLKNLKMGTQDITLYAIFEKEPEPTHIVTYKYLAENGEEIIADSKEYVKNEEIDLSITVSKDGYKFLGWNTDKKATETLKNLKMGTQDITLYAIFEKEPEPTHIVTYKYLAENGEEIIADSKEYVKNEEIDLSITVSKDGYKFLGWNTDKKATETLKNLKMGTQDITLYAIFEKEPEPTHIVTYKYLSKNGIVIIVDSKKYVKDEEIDLSIPASKDGYKFLGWNTDKNATEILKSLKMGTQDITLYAIFEKEKDNEKPSMLEIKTQYIYNEKNNTVTGKIISNNPLKDTKPTWNLDESKYIYTKQFEKNQEYQTKVEDIYGNVIEVTIKIELIDEKGPEVEVHYSYNESENTVTASIESDEEMADTKPTWILSDDKKTYIKKYDSNEDYITSVKDKWGNETKVNIKINQIDKVGPKISMEYKYNNDDSVTVMMHSNEEMADTKPTWILSDDKLTYYKNFTTNEKYYTKVEDVHGNLTNVEINFKKKLDRNQPNGLSVGYMFIKDCKVLVQILSPEKMLNTKPTWEYKDNGYRYIKSYYENINYNTTVDLKNGIRSKVHINVDYFK